MNRSERIMRELCELAGVELNTNAPDAILVKSPDFYTRVLANGSLSVGETYMDGLWDCARLDSALTKFMRLHDSDINKFLAEHPLYLLYNFFAHLKAKLLNLQSIVRAGIVGEKHYDLGNDLYERMLDSRMQYTCAYWKKAKNLEQAQEAKLELICRKLGLKPGMRLLDIGCGWGGLLRYAAECYGVSGVGITISKQQRAYAKDICAGFDIEIRLQDYRELNERFDRIASIGMLEHVGVKNYPTYMRAVAKLLKDEESLFLLQTIGNNISLQKGNAWLNKYIFPNGMLPSMRQIIAAAEGRLIIEDWHSFGPDYDKTLMSWYANFTGSWQEIADRYSTRFYRMWEFYLLSCAANFRARKTQLWQLVCSSHGLPGGYTPIR